MAAEIFADCTENEVKLATEFRHEKTFTTKSESLLFHTYPVLIYTVQLLVLSR